MLGSSRGVNSSGMRLDQFAQSEMSGRPIVKVERVDARKENPTGPSPEYWACLLNISRLSERASQTENALVQLGVAEQAARCLSTGMSDRFLPRRSTSRSLRQPAEGLCSHNLLRQKSNVGAK